MLRIIKNIIWRLKNMFNKDSGLVKVWVSLILSGIYTYEQCPNLSNLKTIVGDVLTEAGYNITQTA